ncbi:hypothetical protein, partial [Klebsiella grimontii]|uniref:hypothetical protein n=1 Tax=Klebsiella grimontii TaxID=2058152 RepID=UPI001C498479
KWMVDLNIIEGLSEGDQTVFKIHGYPSLFIQSSPVYRIFVDISLEKEIGLFGLIGLITCCIDSHK